jgi:hypothetical protein
VQRHFNDSALLIIKLVRNRKLPMVSREYALKLGQQCIKLADRAETVAERRQLIRLAADWVRLANERLGTTLAAAVIEH